MKKILLCSVLLIFCFTFNANVILGETLTDTTSIKYIPLAVGNVYKYHFSSSGGMNYDYKIRIYKDTIIGSKRYFVMSGPALYRYDSLSGNYYRRSVSDYCSYSPYEVLMDSLASKKGDSILRCMSPVKRYCTDTSNGILFGIPVKTKTFRQYNFEGYEAISYSRGFGISGHYTQDIGGMSSDWLVGCCINGVLYGDTTLTEVTNLNTEIPDKFLLYQNYPNPFNPVTKIKFEIPENGFPIKTFGNDRVVLKIYDLLGREIQTLVNEKLNPGSYEVIFDGSNYASGVYFYQLRSGDFKEVKRAVLIK